MSRPTMKSAAQCVSRCVAVPLPATKVGVVVLPAEKASVKGFVLRSAAP
jgi:hypothetical protein